MKRKVFKGWTSRRYLVGDVISFDTDDGLILDDVFRTKGEKSMWDERDWPPKRVTITVEIED